LASGSGAVGRGLRPAVIARGAASRSGRSRSPAPGAIVARRCCCAARTGCLAGTAGPAPGSGSEPAQNGRQEWLNHRPQVIVHDPRPSTRPTPERLAPHISHGLPGHFNKIVLRAHRV
jgi:hypothetical protein